MLELCRCPNIYGPDCICTFTFSYLADAFIQSDLQMRTIYSLNYMCSYFFVFLFYVFILNI